MSVNKLHTHYINIVLLLYMTFEPIENENLRQIFSLCCFFCIKKCFLLRHHLITLRQSGTLRIVTKYQMHILRISIDLRTVIQGLN